MTGPSAGARRDNGDRMLRKGAMNEGAGSAVSGTAARTTAVVVLAAGLSERMGEPKLLMDVAGAPMIRRTLENVLAFGPAQTVVVTGHGAAAIEAALKGLPVRFAHNPDYAQGHHGSVAVGVAAVSREVDAVMVMLGDQPLVGAAHLSALAAAFAALPAGAILVPHYAGQRGNPVVFAAAHIPELSGETGRPGGRRLIESRPDLVHRLDMDSDVFVLDCDTPDDYRRLIARIGEAAHG